jgi:hypothetical protein
VNVENVNLSDKLKQFVNKNEELEEELKNEKKASEEKTGRIRLL